MSVQGTKTIRLPRLLPHQEAILASSDPLILLLGGIGSGKTHSLGYMAIRGACDHPGLESAIFAPSYTLFRRVTLPKFQAVVPPDLYEWRPGDHIIEWITGAVTYCLGVDRTPEQRIVGMNLAWFCWDEPGASPNGRIIGLIEQRLRAGDPALRFGALFTSPHGHTWLKDWSEKPSVRVVRASTYDNPYLDEGFLRTLEEEFPPGSLLHRQELLGEFVVRTGLLYPMWTRSAHVVEEGYSPDLPYELGWDPGARAAGVVAVQVRGGRHVVVREWTPDDEFTEDTARRVRQELGASPAAIYLDTPSRLNTRTGITDTHALQAVFPRADVRVLGGRKRSSDYRHRAVSGALHRGMLAVSRSLVPRRVSQAERGIVRALEALAWQEESTRDERQPEKDPLKHVMDALEFYTAARIAPRYVDSEDRAA